MKPLISKFRRVVATEILIKDIRQPASLRLRGLRVTERRGDDETKGL